ncbi:MAG: hypothetical protein ACE5H4_08565 [Candidatus Thorarchaeota archaeon]
MQLPLFDNATCRTNVYSRVVIGVEFALGRVFIKPQLFPQYLSTSDIICRNYIKEGKVSQEDLQF